MAEEDVDIEKPLPLFGEKKATEQVESQNDGDGDKNGARVQVESEQYDLYKMEPHPLMLLYDLFFAANLTAFSNIHDTTSMERLSAYIGYFSVLWFLWLNVMLFDVRFVADSISERILRAIHLGAMVGVSVVAPQYNPAQQVKGTFQAFSIILMISRVILAVQYGLATRYEPSRARKGLIVMALCHAAAAVIYLGVTFRFTDSTNSRVFVTWYIVGSVETILIFILSVTLPGLEFTGPELPDRMKTATLLILGEGVIVVAEHVSTIVKNVNSWTSETIGVLCATVALIYVIFQIYFDWSWPIKVFPPRKPHLYFWVFFHFPFHLSLVLIMEGATQFVVWWKIVELINFVTDQFHIAFIAAENSGASDISVSMANHLRGTIDAIWEHYPPDLLVTLFHRDELLWDIGNISDAYWRTDFPDVESMAADPRYQEFTDDYRALQVTVLNSILKNFNIEEIEDSGWRDHPSTYEEHAFQDAADRFNLVYIYVFCFAGAALILMALLHILARPKGTQMQKVVFGINVVLGMGLMLLASMSRYDSHAKFTTTPWIVPSICLIFFLALILVHGSRWYDRQKRQRRVESSG